LRRLALLFAGAAVWLLLAVPVFADNGPHQQGASATTDGCSGCHRAHTARAANLLANPSQTSLCYTCHGSTGTGATTNVQDGQQYVPTNLAQIITVTRGTTVAGGLRGGGFDHAVIDTGLTLGGAAEVGVLGTFANTTSAHAISGTGTAWGNGGLNTGAGPTINMTCGSCHDPHGNGSYRILKPIPEESGAAAPGVAIADASSYLYTTQDYWQPADPFAPAYASQVTAWCSTCHTRYMAPSGAGHTDSGDAIYTYRHATTNGPGLQCVKCHVSHGSNASMGVNSQAVPWPGTSTPRGTDSNLLRIDNRGTCQKCHNK
jgi:predicted CXXCH cytochrome family protein